QSAQEGSNKKRRVPSKAGSDGWSQRRGDGTAQLRAHVHETGCRPGSAAGDTGCDRPVGTLQKVDRAGASRKNQARDASAGRVRTKDKKKSREEEGEYGDAAAAGALSMSLRNAVVDHAPQ